MSPARVVADSLRFWTEGVAAKANAKAGGSLSAPNEVMEGSEGLVYSIPLG